MKKIPLVAIILFLSCFATTEAQTLQESCELNNVDACMALGNEQQTINSMAAFKAFEKACSLGNAEGCYRAAFARNWNFGKDAICPSTARKFLRRSCRLGYARACTDLVDIWRFWDP